MDKWKYISEIAERGDHYGGHGGTLDLLNWCRKLNIVSVTAEEAKQFLEDPSVPYNEEANKGRC